MRLLQIIIAAVFLALPGLAQESPVIDFEDSDAAMNAAIADARATLPIFFAVFDDPGGQATDLSLKVAVPVGNGGHEHIWTGQIRRTGEAAFEAQLANDPVDFVGKLGDPIRFAEDEISDWGYMADDGLHGHYTTRVMLPLMDAETAAYVETLLAPLPE